MNTQTPEQAPPTEDVNARTHALREVVFIARPKLPSGSMRLVANSDSPVVRAGSIALLGREKKQCALQAPSCTP
eukprot:5184660-Amphidinium_carterae.1